MKTDAAGKVTKWVYDGNGNVLAVMYPDGTNESLFWLEGKIVAHTLTNSGTTTTEFFGTDALSVCVKSLFADHHWVWKIRLFKERFK